MVGGIWLALVKSKNLFKCYNMNQKVALTFLSGVFVAVHFLNSRAPVPLHCQFVLAINRLHLQPCRLLRYHTSKRRLSGDPRTLCRRGRERVYSEAVSRSACGHVGGFWRLVISGEDGMQLPFNTGWGNEEDTATRNLLVSLRPPAAAGVPLVMHHHSAGWYVP